MFQMTTAWKIAKRKKTIGEKGKKVQKMKKMNSKSLVQRWKKMPWGTLKTRK
jgi:hypothetical protein